jgi:hypothetical protein
LTPNWKVFLGTFIKKFNRKILYHKINEDVLHKRYFHLKFYVNDSFVLYAPASIGNQVAGGEFRPALTNRRAQARLQQFMAALKTAATKAPPDGQTLCRCRHPT